MPHKFPIIILATLLLSLMSAAVFAQTPAFESGVLCSPSTPCPDDATIALNPGDVAAGSVSPARGVVVEQVAARAAAQAASDGFWLAWAVMVVLVLALLYALVAAVMAALGSVPPVLRGRLTTAIPILSVLGLGVAIYLTVVETQNVEPVCGPVGDCGAVQASPFAMMFGFLPVGLLGAVGYVLIIASWFSGRFGSGTLARLAPLAIFAMTLFGVVFSIYLTYLELFVIRAVCIWCVTSAFIMSFVLLLSVGPAVDTLFAEE
jgi:uncharacterized membrane protein